MRQQRLLPRLRRLLRSLNGGVPRPTQFHVATQGIVRNLDIDGWLRGIGVASHISNRSRECGSGDE